jgi:hypothetical protein
MSQNISNPSLNAGESRRHSRGTLAGGHFEKLMTLQGCEKLSHVGFHGVRRDSIGAGQFFDNLGYGSFFAYQFQNHRTGGIGAEDLPPLDVEHDSAIGCD